MFDIAFDALNSEIVLKEEAHYRTGSGIAHVVNTETGKAEKYFDPFRRGVSKAFDTEDKENLKITDNTVELRIEEIRPRNSKPCLIFSRYRSA